MSVVIRAARPDEAEGLSELAVRSKGHWGYDEEFLESCRAELAVRPEQCDGVHLQVAASPTRPPPLATGIAFIRRNPPSPRRLVS